jgi:hypothetical protein
MNTKDDRRCLICGDLVTNRTLGGNHGKSALTGILFCEAHADGPNRPSSKHHPLHSDFVVLVEEAKAVVTAAVETALEIDGTPASAAYAIKLRYFASIMALRAEWLAIEQIGKAKKA